MSEHERRLRESLGPSMLHHLELLLAEKAAALAQARADALEEAAQVCDAAQRIADEKKSAVGVGQAAWWSISMEQKETAQRIRAIATIPPASIPVAKVREVLRILFEESDSAGERYALTQVMGRLGVPLDGGAGKSAGIALDALSTCPHGRLWPHECNECIAEVAP